MKRRSWKGFRGGVPPITRAAGGDGWQPNGTVTIWAITSTVSGGGDQGADPNKLVTITDQPGATSAPPSESFLTVQSARSGQVLRGVSFTPGTGAFGR